VRYIIQFKFNYIEVMICRTPGESSRGETGGVETPMTRSKRMGEDNLDKGRCVCCFMGYDGFSRWSKGLPKKDELRRMSQQRKGKKQEVEKGQEIGRGSERNGLLNISLQCLSFKGQSA
jgi:hypothetical protein